MKPTDFFGVVVGVVSLRSGLPSLSRALERSAVSGTSMMALESSVISGEGSPSGSCVGRWPTAMILRSGPDQETIFLEGVDGDAVGRGDDDDLVGAEAYGVDGFGVDEVDVVAGGEDGGHQLRGDEALHGSGDGDVGGGEAGPGVVGGEEDGDLVGGLTLAE